MSTRCFISLRKPDGYLTVYCHHDGYLEGVGAVLASNYSTLESVEALLEMGDMSGLGADIASSVFYTRDREEFPEECAAYLYPALDEMLADAAEGVQYVYVFDDGWKCIYINGKTADVKLGV